MSIIKPRAGVLGLLAVLLVGLFAAASAEAQGPFWYKRALNGQGKGVKISNQQGRQWEEVRGGGGEAKLEGKLGTNEIIIVAKQVQVKGIVYNNGLQGQAKLEFAYFQPELVKPSGTSCLVTIGSKNVVKVYGHQAWTWDGSEGQLHEQPQQHQKPDWIFLGQEIQQGATGLPSNVPFTSITIKGTGCLLSTQANVTGSVAASIEPGQVGAFSTSQTATALPNGTKQHFWNGTENRGVETALAFNGEPAKLEQTDTVSTVKFQEKEPQQELGLWGD